MTHSAAFLAEDRRLALAQGEEPARQAQGTVLFVDISGFTPLTETLLAELGRRAGADAATGHLNAIYTVLIDAIQRHGGSVVGFSGDGLLCWYDAASTDSAATARRALAAAAAVQTRMKDVASIAVTPQRSVTLAVKAALATGAVQRFAAGDPRLQLIDVIAGATVDRAAQAEQLAGKGEIVADRATVTTAGLNPDLLRGHAAHGEFDVVTSDIRLPDPAESVRIPLVEISDRLCAPWLLPAVRARLQRGQERFLGEIRPATALFVRFGDLDFDRDPDAADKLDSYVRWVQARLETLEGTLVQLSTGDKGSYLYSAFGAPLAHDDDVQRAATVAQWLLSPPEHLPYRPAPQIGLASGRMRVGAYGSDTRCAYGVQGAAVNLAARLMMAAAPGTILTDAATAEQLGHRFALAELPPMVIKGHTEPRPVFALTASREHVAPGSNWFALPLRGRRQELAELSALAQTVTTTGRGMVVQVEGEAGSGKSHLLAAAADQRRAAGFVVASAAARSTERSTSYFAARQIARRLLRVDRLGDATTAAQIAHVTELFTALNPAWLPRLPLLGDLLGLPMPENELTAAMDARLRRDALADLVADIAAAAARTAPLLVLVDDGHWLDEASLDLLLRLAQATVHAPIMLLIALRPETDTTSTVHQRLTGLGYQTRIRLGPLADDAAAAIVADLLAAPVDPLALDLLRARAQGNPLLLETLIDTLCEEHQLVQPVDAAPWELAPGLLATLRAAGVVEETGEGTRWRARGASVELGLPDSIHGMVLARIDRLPDREKLTLKVASVLGRAFAPEVLARVHPLASDASGLESDLATLAARGFLQQSVDDDVGVLAFRHNATQEVVYNTLLVDQRRELHLAAGLTVEALQPDAVEQLAHHFVRSDTDRPALRHKCLHYLDLAAARAQREYANETALLLLEQALALEVEPRRVLRKVDLLHLLGRRTEEEASLRALDHMPTGSSFDIAFAWGRYYEALSRYEPAVAALTVAQQRAPTAGAKAQAQARLGLISWRQGDYATAAAQYEEALTTLAEDSDHIVETADTRYGLGLVYRQQGQYQAALAEFTRALAVYRAVGHRPNEAKTLIAIGHVEHHRSQLDAAMNAYAAALPLYRMSGDRAGIGTATLSLAQGYGSLGDHAQSRAMLQDARTIYQALGDIWSEILVWNELGVVAMMVGEYGAAETDLRRGLALSESIGDESGVAYTLCNLGQVLRDDRQLDDADAVLQRCLDLARKQTDPLLEATALAEQALARLYTERYEDALDLATRSTQLLLGLELEAATIANHTTCAQAWHALGETKQAIAAVDDACQLLAVVDIDGLSFPQRDYFVCAQLLQQFGDRTRAAVALDHARGLMEERAARISDPELRAAYLTNLPFNRMIAAASKT